MYYVFPTYDGLTCSATSWASCPRTSIVMSPLSSAAAVTALSELGLRVALLCSATTSVDAHLANSGRRRSPSALIPLLEHLRSIVRDLELIIRHAHNTRASNLRKPWVKEEEYCINVFVGREAVKKRGGTTGTTRPRPLADRHIRNLRSPRRVSPSFTLTSPCGHSCGRQRGPIRGLFVEGRRQL